LEKTQLVIQNIIFLEPVTALTDFIIVALCLLFTVKLKQSEENNRYNILWIRFFSFVALSSFLGGLAHLFFFYLEGSLHKTLWLLMNIASAVSVYFAELSAIEILINQNKKRYNILAACLLIIFTVAGLILQNFNIAKINMGIGLLFILIAHIITFQRGIKGGLFIIAGMFLSFIPVAIHSLKWSLHAWFNFNDISHIFMMLCLYFIFKGVSKFNETISNNINFNLINSAL